MDASRPISLFPRRISPDFVPLPLPAGGDRHFYYPKQVWTPSGGWWNHKPEGYKRNYALAWLAIGGIAYALFTFSANNEVGSPCRARGSGAPVLAAATRLRCCLPLAILQRRPIVPRRPIPSQLWCRYAGNDDPHAKAPYVPDDE